MTILLGTWRELRRKLCLHDGGDGIWEVRDWQKVLIEKNNNRPNERITARLFFTHKGKEHQAFNLVGRGVGL